MRYFILVLALLVTGCASYSPNLPSFKPYKLDIQQGNVVTPKMMLQLRPGMTKAQVSFIMGTPLLTDSFHADRWDYFYQMNRDGKVIEQRRIILEFEGDALSHVRGDVIPTGNGDESMTVKPITEPKADLEMDDKPGKRDEKSWLDKLKFWGGDEKAKPAAEPKVEPESKPEAEPEPATVAVPAPEPATTQEEKPSAKPTEEKKGWLDKLKFWGSDEKAKPVAEPKVEPQAAPEPEPEPEPAAAPAPAVEVAPEPVSAPAAEPKAEAAPEPAPVPEPMAEPKVEATPAPEPAIEPKVAPEPAPVAEPKVVPAPAPAPAPKVEATPATQPKVETKPAKPVPQAEKVAPQPKDLPSEDAPDYFEKMLEKIGF
jgi:outer membrane protein assembly factor BamE